MVNGTLPEKYTTSSLVTNRPALTYNAAGLSLPTLYRYGVLSKSTANINAYIIRNEPLNFFQTHNMLGIPQAQGNIHYLGDWSLYFIPINPFSHSIDAVIDQLPYW